MVKIRPKTINLPIIYIDKIAELIKKGRYGNRSDLVRCAVREFMANENEFNKYLDSIRKEYKRKRRHWVKIITVSLPYGMIDDIEIFKKDTYPSGSEIIRVAVHDLLKQEMHMDKKYTHKKEINLENEINHDAVKVPLSNGKYKTYNIIKRLE